MINNNINQNVPLCFPVLIICCNHDYVCVKSEFIFTRRFEMLCVLVWGASD